MLREKVNSIAKKLSAKNVKPLKISEWTEFSDPTIRITESIYIQVGIDYVVIFRVRLASVAIYECSDNVDDIMKKLKQAINEDK